MNISTLLQSFGLSDSESTVYLAALEHEYMTAGQIAEASGTKRSTVYYILEQLIEKGLMVTAGSKVTKFKAASAEQLFTLLERRQAELKILKKQLKRSIDDFPGHAPNPTGPPGVEFFKGPEGLKTLGEKMLQCRSKMIYTFGAPFTAIENTDMQYVEGLLRRRAENGIVTKSIWQDMPKEVAIQDNSELLREVRLAPAPLPAYSNSMISIVDNSVIIINFQPELVGMYISSVSFSDTMKGIWEVVWGQSVPLGD